YVLGLFLKGTPKVPNWLIPWIIGVLGVALGFGIGGFNVTAAIQGILAAAAAVYGNQLWKQVVNGINEKKE
ncbi:phage holin family protein, partial [Eubacterium limosum]|uniref:phage holin family protein n=2 Tax=Eubacteriaceae TaxID=186806 RepID=UPI001D064780